MENENNANNIREQYLKMIQQQLAEKKAEEELDNTIRSLVEDAARERLANIKLVNKELYLKAAQAIIYLYNTRRLTSKITDNQLKELLSKLNPKREIKIRRK
ncbi:MAG: hypothetical protein N3D73_01620 [Candidatus Diapherotrites archaeon]|nr:hypothetical protein [Candidatus Diapherotrites archaeon]